MPQRQQQKATIMSAKSATGAGNKILVDDFRHLNLSIGTLGLGASDTILVKVAGSIADEAPDFDAARSASNLWDYVDCKEIENGADLDGDTGILFEDSDDVVQIAINVDGLRWITAIVSTISDPTTSVTVIAKLYND